MAFDYSQEMDVVGTLLRRISQLLPLRIFSKGQMSRGSFKNCGNPQHMTSPCIPPLQFGAVAHTRRGERFQVTAQEGGALLRCQRGRMAQRSSRFSIHT